MVLLALLDELSDLSSRHDNFRSICRLMVQFRTLLRHRDYMPKKLSSYVLGWGKGVS